MFESRLDEKIIQTENNIEKTKDKIEVISGRILQKVSDVRDNLDNRYQLEVSKNELREEVIELDRESDKLIKLYSKLQKLNNKEEDED